MVSSRFPARFPSFPFPHLYRGNGKRSTSAQVRKLMKCKDCRRPSRWNVRRPCCISAPSIGPITQQSPRQRAHRAGAGRPPSLPQTCFSGSPFARFPNPKVVSFSLVRSAFRFKTCFLSRPQSNFHGKKRIPNPAPAGQLPLRRAPASSTGHLGAFAAPSGS